RKRCQNQGTIGEALRARQDDGCIGPTARGNNFDEVRQHGPRTMRGARRFRNRNVKSATLGPSLEDHVEWPLRRPSNRVNPPSRMTSVSLASPACAPKPSPTSWSSDVGTQIIVEAL